MRRAQILKYLANNLGLAPDEARPAAFEVEKRMIDYKYRRTRIPNRPARNVTLWAA